jgi:hypothetical protein
MSSERRTEKVISCGQNILQAGNCTDLVLIGMGEKCLKFISIFQQEKAQLPRIELKQSSESADSDQYLSVKESCLPGEVKVKKRPCCC